MTQPSDQHLVLGDVPDQVSSDVGSMVSGTAGRDSVGDQLRLGSLAHPGWPYAGTAHEWRGFAAMPKAWPSFSVDDHETRYQKLDFGRLD